MKFHCSVDNRPCGEGASEPCAKNHPEKCTARYIKVKKREEDYEEWRSLQRENLKGQGR